MVIPHHKCMNTAGGVGVLTTITAGILGATLAVLITRHCTKTGEPFHEMKSRSTHLYICQDFLQVQHLIVSLNCKIQYKMSINAMNFS